MDCGCLVYKPAGNLTQAEVHLYGSSRLGVWNINRDVSAISLVTPGQSNTFVRGNKFFELSNHLGNVLATVSDKKLQHSTDGINVDYFTAEVVTANDYYPGGMLMPGRRYGSMGRFGFNGKENDNEVKGEGNQQDYGMRIYDTRLVRFLSVDPLTRKYPYYTPYQFAGNSPIKFIDLDGGEPKEPDQKEYSGKTWAIDEAFSKTGGESKYGKSPATEEIGVNAPVVDKAKFFANDNGNNSTVNEKSQFLVTNEAAFKTTRDLVNKLLGDFIWGKGPENIVFPENGRFSTELKGSIAVGETLVDWAKNKFNDGIYRWDMKFRGEINVDMSSGFTSLEHFIGSCAVKISLKNEAEIKVEIFNVTSFNSGYLTKDIPIIGWFVSAPSSTQRYSPDKNFNKDGYQPTYSNTSQYFSFTMSTSEANKLIGQFSGGTAPLKK